MGLPFFRNPFPLILNNPPPPPRNSKCVFNIRGRFVSKCHVWGPKGLGSGLGREGRELQDVGWLEGFGSPEPRNGV